MGNHCLIARGTKHPDLKSKKLKTAYKQINQVQNFTFYDHTNERICIVFRCKYTLIWYQTIWVEEQNGLCTNHSEISRNLIKLCGNQR